MDPVTVEADQDGRPSGVVAWLATCVAHEATPADVRAIRRWGTWMVLWAVVTLLDPAWFGGEDGVTSVVTVTRAVLVVATLVGVTVSYMRYVAGTDELNRSIQLRSLAWGFSAGLLTMLVVRTLQEAGLVGAVDVDLPAAAMLVAYALSSIRISVGYR